MILILIIKINPSFPSSLSSTQTIARLIPFWVQFEIFLVELMFQILSILVYNGNREEPSLYYQISEYFWSSFMIVRSISDSFPKQTSVTINLLAYFNIKFSIVVIIQFTIEGMRNEWNLIMQKGAMRFCPNPSCKSRWVKDSDCTHMKWFTCGTNYCYFWGKAEADCNKSDSNGGLARHNDDWKTNPKRCPIFLLQIHKIDKRWNSGSDNVCMALFHKLLTYTYIKLI